MTTGALREHLFAYHKSAKYQQVSSSLVTSDAQFPLATSSERVNVVLVPPLIVLPGPISDCNNAARSPLNDWTSKLTLPRRRAKLSRLRTTH